MKLFLEIVGKTLSVVALFLMAAAYASFLGREGINPFIGVPATFIILCVLVFVGERAWGAMRERWINRPTRDFVRSDNTATGQAAIARRRDYERARCLYEKALANNVVGEDAFVRVTPLWVFDPNNPESLKALHGMCGGRVPENEEFFVPPNEEDLGIKILGGWDAWTTFRGHKDPELPSQP